MLAIGEGEVTNFALAQICELIAGDDDLLVQLPRTVNLSQIGMRAGVHADFDSGGGHFANLRGRVGRQRPTTSHVVRKRGPGEDMSRGYEVSEGNLLRQQQRQGMLAV